MGELSFKYAYKVPDQMDNVCELSTSMIFTENLKLLIRNSYSETLIDNIHLAEIRNTAL